MALRALQGPAGGSAPVGGSGTTNTIPRWTGPTTLGDSVITQDGSIIGIRQATPSAYLAGFNTLVVGDAALANTGITLVSGTASDGTFAFADGTVGNAAYRGYIQYKHATDTMQIGTAASPQITVLSTGNVGIGTATPLSYANYVSLTIGDNNAAKTGILKFRSTYNGGNGAEIFQSTAGVLAISANGSRSIMAAQNTGGTDSAAQVAIGTSSFTTSRALTTVADLDVFGVRVGRGGDGSGAANTTLGKNALVVGTSGDFNTAIGEQALTNLTTGASNTAIGRGSLTSVVSTDSNIALGRDAGYNSTGASNIFIGRLSAAAAAADNNKLVIGSASYWVATDGAAATYYTTATAVSTGTLPATCGFMRVLLNGTWVKIPVYAD